MEQCRKSLLRAPVFITLLKVFLAPPLAGQTFTTLYHFTRGTDGANPYAGLILSAGALYGTAYSGGSSGQGTVFQVNTDGSNFITLHSFTAVPDFNATNSDGAAPFGP